MNILLTNDDGFGSLGINALYQEFKSLGNIYIAAPAQEKSGTSHAITVRNTVQIQWHAENQISVSGFPADCVNIAIPSRIFSELDLVISGINHGPNMGEDVIYSGTVAGARQGYMHGITSIAVSLASVDGSPQDFQDAARWTREFVEKALNLEATSEQRHANNGKGVNKGLFNLNIPNPQNGEIQGFRFTRLGKRKYIDEYKILKSQKFDHFNNGHKYPGLDGQLPVEVMMQGIISHEPEEGNTDFNALDDGYISVTPLKLDQTDFSFFDEWKEVYPDRMNR
jgi:5'-nucleotidase